MIVLSQLCKHPLKAQFTQKWKCCHHLLTFKLFQTCMNFYLLLNTKEDSIVFFLYVMGDEQLFG